MRAAIVVVEVLAPGGPEFAAVLDGDMAAVGEIGLAKVAGALA